MAEFTIALDSNDQEVSIDYVQKGHEYTCVNCGQPMIPIQGQEREWHFRHKENSTNCNHDGWLHKKLVQLLYDRLCTDEQFKIICPNHEIHNGQAVVLKEKEYETFRPDILIEENNKDVYFLEVCVTHPCTEEKTKSGIKIIEIETSDARSINELKTDNISNAGKFYKINYYNFLKKNDETETLPDLVSGNPVYDKRNSYFVLHRDKTYNVYNDLIVRHDDLMVLGVNVTNDFAMNIGKTYAYRKRLLKYNELSDYELKIDLQAIIEYFHLIKYKIDDI